MFKSHLNEKWESCLETCLTKYGFTTFRINMSQDKKVKQRSGSIIFVSLQGRKESEFRVEYLIMKTIGESEEQIREMKTDEMCKTEHQMYSTVLPKFHTLQAHLASVDHLKFATCYGSGPEYIIMSDLTMENFSEEYDFLDADMIIMALVDLARFHAFSFGLKQNKPSDYLDITQDLDKGFFYYNELNEKTLEDTLNSTLDSLKYEELKEKFKKAVRSNLDKVKNQCKERGEKSVVIHGDYNKNNLLFKCDEDGEATDIRMLDFQLSRVASPMIDVLYLLLTSSKDISNYEMYLDMYHDSLRMFLKKFQCRIDEIYDKPTMLKEFKDYLFYAIIQFLYSAPDLYEGDAFKSRIQEIVKELDLLKMI